MKKKILIVGNGAREYALAKKLSFNYDVYITPSSDGLKEFATCLDIRENNIKELLNFVLENDIDMTIPISRATVENDIASVFAANKQSVFAPSKSASKYFYDKSLMKKTLYKLHIPIPKFGIFEKDNIIFDYLKNQKIPFVLKTNEENSAVVLTAMQSAKNIINSMLIDKNNKIIIEDYVYGTGFSFYALSDGYKALPIGSTLTYNYVLEGDGGQLTSGMGACSPNYKLSIEQEYTIMDDIIYPILEYLENVGSPYLGVIGLDGILTDDNKICIIGLKTFMSDCDAAGILDNIDDDLYSLLESCVIGSFSDEVNTINQKPQYAVSLALRCNISTLKENIINGIDSIDDDTLISFPQGIKKNKYLEYEIQPKSAIILTSSGATVSSASDNVYRNANLINFSGLSYRKDIARPLIIA